MVALLRHRLSRIAAAFVALFAAWVSPAWADASSEAFVKENLQRALKELSDPTLSPEQQTERFGALMDEFADLPRIAEFVVGRYAGKLRKDPVLYREWRDAFREYALTVYEGQLDRYRGESAKILSGTQDTTINGRRYSVVPTEITQPNGRSLTVNWRLIKTDGGWRVVDVALRAGDNTVWLGIQQRQDFLAVLGKNNGDVRALIEDVRSRTGVIKRMLAEQRA